MKHTDNLELWFTDLETTELPQGTQQLGSETLGLCCLGLGCKTAGIEFNFDDSLPNPAFPRWLDDTAVPLKRDIREEFVATEYQEAGAYNLAIFTRDVDWSHMPQRFQDNKDEIVAVNATYLTFSELNDGVGIDNSDEDQLPLQMTFKEIAVFARAHVEHLFVTEQ